MKILRPKMILILLSTIFLSSCKSIPFPKGTVERCGIYLVPIEEEIYKGKCRCHDYKVDAKFTGQVGESYDKPLDYCKRLVGFKATEWTRYFTPWFLELQIFNKQTKDYEDDYFQGDLDGESQSEGSN